MSRALPGRLSLLSCTFARPALLGKGDATQLNQNADASSLMRKILPLLAALTLAACSQPAPSEDSGRPADSPATADNGPATPGPAPSPAPEPAPEPQAQTIPAAFHGVWAATSQDCKAPAETRLEIGADRLRFYESSGTVKSVDSSKPDEILVAVALSGEGAMSQRSFRYRLLEDGEELFDVRNGLRRIRCPTA